jgi:hypothetical protein
MNIEYIYKLNFPDIKEMLLPHRYEEMFEATSESSRFLSCGNPNSYLKEEYLTFKQYRWNTSLLFYKSKGTSGDLHTDLPAASWAINYIISTGGDNVCTCFYQNKSLIEQHIIEPFRWHWINVSIPHTVINLKKDSTRISVTISY